MIEDLDSIWPIDPDEHGMEICGHCNGYGSSLKEKEDRCTKCGGRGLIKTKAQPCLFCNVTGTHRCNCPCIK